MSIQDLLCYLSLLFCVEIIKAGQLPVTESQLERVIEELEVRCWERIQTIVKNEEGLGIEYDENVICDVCRSVSNYISSTHRNLQDVLAFLKQC